MSLNGKLRVSQAQQPDPGDGGDNDDPYAPTSQCTPVVADSAVVEENITDSIKTKCIDSAFLKMTKPSINKMISNWYNKNAVGPNSPINIEFDEAPNLTKLRTDGSGITDTLPAMTTHLPGSANYKITFNNSYLSYPGYNMSSEAWGQVIIHELLHIFIINAQLSSTTTQDHLFMFKNLINPSRDLLVTAFGMSNDDATDLALNGLGDLWQYSDFETQCINAYSRTKSQILTTRDNYSKKNKGTKCK